jgi:hypothetical protein
MGCCNCIDKQVLNLLNKFIYTNRNKPRSHQDDENNQKQDLTDNNTSFELKNEDKDSKLKQSKNTNISYQESKILK